MTYEKTIKISKNAAEKIRKYLTEEPANESECLSEDEIISETANFGNGIEMDIKCCGVQFQEGENNTAWSEAVLFDNGSEVSCTEPCDEFIGDWELEYKDNKYIAHVEIA